MVTLNIQIPNTKYIVLPKISEKFMLKNIHLPKIFKYQMFEYQIWILFGHPKISEYQIWIIYGQIFRLSLNIQIFKCTNIQTNYSNIQILFIPIKKQNTEYEKY